MGRRKGNDDAGAAADAGAGGTAGGACCAGIPFVQAFCTLLILGGVVLFLIKGSEAFGATGTMLKELKVMSTAQATAAAAMSTIMGVGGAVVVVVLVLALLATLAAASGRVRRYRVKHGAKLTSAHKCGASFELGSSVLVILLMWIFLAATVGLIALFTAFFLGAFSGDHGSSYAMGTTTKIQEKIASGLKKVDSLFKKMRSAWDGLVQRVPSFLRSNSWFTDLTRDIGGPLLVGSNELSNVTCADDCLDLGAFATMMSFEPRCVCGKEMLTTIKTRMDTAWHAAVASLVALAVIAIAGSWILMCCVAQFVHAKRDLGAIKAAVAADERAGAGGPPRASSKLASDVETAANDQLGGR